MKNSNLAELTRRFVGTRRLLSWQNRAGDQVTYPMGCDAKGYITYQQDGRMFVAIMKNNRSHLSSGDLFGATLEEKAAAAGTFLAYCGIYEIRAQSIIHHIEVSSFPNWVGQSQERFFEFRKGLLILSTAPLMMGGVESIAQLVWAAVEDKL